MRHLLLRRGRRRKWTRRSGSVGIVGVAWRAAEAVRLLIHGETGRGGGAPGRCVNSTRSGSGLKAGRRRRRVLVITCVSVGLPLGTKGSAELFESGGHQVEVRRMKGGE